MAPTAAANTTPTTNTEAIGRATKITMTDNETMDNLQMQDIPILAKVKNTTLKIMTSNAVVTEGTVSMKAMMIATLAHLKITP